MIVGLIGLGKMGLALAQNLVDHKHTVLAFDVSGAAKSAFNQYIKGLSPSQAAAESQTFESLHELVDAVHKACESGGRSQRPLFWMMIPAGKIVDNVLNELHLHLKAGDILVDGGNSHYQDTLKRAERLQSIKVSFMDAGTSGGVSGARSGGCFMVGGDADAFSVLEPILQDISTPNGYYYTGSVGSGHFLKMVHNGIEYGMMQALGEGFELLERSPFDYDFAQVARVWNHGSVIRCWLMELLEKAFKEDPKLEGIRGVMHSSGEGKWTVESALDLGVPTPVIALSLLMRYRSETEDAFHGKVVAALRNQFGGHEVEKAPVGSV